MTRTCGHYTCDFPDLRYSGHRRGDAWRCPECGTLYVVRKPLLGITLWELLRRQLGLAYWAAPWGHWVIR